MKNIVVLISGNGSNLQAIINACHTKKINGAVCAVFSDRTCAYGLERAKKAGIPTHVVNEMNVNRNVFDDKLMQKIDKYVPDLVILAGYMRILSSNFVNHYKGQLINIHPSLLPKYPGLNTHRQVLTNKDKEHGASVHFVTNKLDNGPIIIQAKINIHHGDNEKQIAMRVQMKEHIIYPLAIKWFVDNRLTMNNDTVWLDGVKLPACGVCYKIT